MGSARVLQFAGLLLAIGLNCFSAEFRGIWVDAFGPGFQNTNQVTKLLDDCRKYNFNAVFVEMRKRGDAYYFPGPNNKEPRATGLSPDFDALAEIIRQCHEGTPRIEVHCWTVSHFVWSWKNPPPQEKHVFNRHPEYLTRDSIGQKWLDPGYFLDPGNPHANQWIHDVATDIVSRYDIDGFHWDYCRYPCQNSGYNEAALARFNVEFGRTDEPSPKDSVFMEWRRRQVTDFLRWVNSDLLQIKPSLIISAAVFSNLTDSRDYRFADWPNWNKQALLDLCIPMDFTADNEHVFVPRLSIAITNGCDRKVYMGEAGFKNTKENTLRQLEQIRHSGFGGSVFYSYRERSSGDSADIKETLALIRRRYQPSWTDTPVLPWKKTAAVVHGTITHGENQPVYNAIVCIQGSEFNETVRTEPHGKYAFFDLRPGRYQLIASNSTSQVAGEVIIAGGEVTNVNLALQSTVDPNRAIRSFPPPLAQTISPDPIGAGKTEEHHQDSDSPEDKERQ